MSFDLNEFAKEVHQNAVDHGWWEDERSFAEIIALCHSELSEALEEAREKKQNIYCRRVGLCRTDVAGHDLTYDFDPEEYTINDAIDGYKPEGTAVEMADCMIRILDWFGKEGIDPVAVLEMKHAYNKTRPYKHGKAF